MKLQDTETKAVFRATALENTGTHIRAYNRNGATVAVVPISRAAVIFNERELPDLDLSSDCHMHKSEQCYGCSKACINALPLTEEQKEIMRTRKNARK